MSVKARRKRRRAKRKQRREARRRRQQTETASTQPEAAPTEMRLIIEQADAWLFRDGKPFRAGEDHWAISLFPPTPLTMQGVIRSKVLLDSDTDLIKYANTPSETEIYPTIGGPGQNYGALRLRGPYLAQNKGGHWIRYYPAPADLLCDKERKVFRRLLVGDNPVVANWPSDNPMRPLYTPQSPNEQDEMIAAGRWMTAEALRAYLLDGKPPEPDQIVPIDNIREPDSRIIIGLDRSVRRPHPQQLAEIEMVQLYRGWALDMDVLGVKRWTSPGYLGIGGEARAGYYRVLAYNPMLAQPNPLPRRFLLYFATPTWFKDGWLPEDWGKWFTGGKITLAAAAVNRPNRIGGWDIVQGEKPLRAYVPAGSVYYFESEDEIKYNGEPVTDDPADGQIGFGQVFIGRWP